MGAKHVDMIVEDSHVYLVSLFLTFLLFLLTSVPLFFIVPQLQSLNQQARGISSTLPPPRALVSATHGSSPSSSLSSRNSQATNPPTPPTRSQVLEHKARKRMSRRMWIAMTPRRPQDRTAPEAMHPLPAVAKGRIRRLQPRAWDPL